MSDGAAPRYLPDLRLAGVWQMAIDAWLLDRAVALRCHSDRSSPPGAALRFYSWTRPTLSLGFHQPAEPRWLQLAAQGELALVRRPSGGAAVLHGGDLTYALVWPQAPMRRKEAYRLACRWLQEAFTRLGQPLRLGDQVASRSQGSCFASGTAADLVHANGSKRIGNAQLWRRGVLLQHGSILLAPPTALWQRVLGEDPPPLAPLPCNREELIATLLQAAHTLLPFGPPPWRPQSLEPAEWSAVASRLQRYRICGDPKPCDPIV